ncbi:hypothetical protein F1D05_12780 [Kribbella qitaiheensis]|uniref:DUF3137 domain-containing protein n=1 Tax=Kribbella qitaiheensis TaxID=1544730 RepID=A0A7G6WXA8_9ACTN|nr:hypothetical protein [Kribbella qitaiheensis]QNE18623.1 hypothetical protein F1D05_12780 [Kribbella qitaiheensis]
MYSGFLVVGAIAVALFGSVIALAIWQAKKRRAFLQARAHAAGQLGWYLAAPNQWLSQVAAGIYQRGRPGEMFAGDFRGRGICALDYTYTTTTSSGPDGQTTTTTHHVFVVALNLPVALPPLQLTMDSKFRRIFGGQDIELESQAFNDAFRINCADQRYASAVLHPRLMEWMLHNPGLEWQFAGNAMVSWGVGLFTIPDVVARLEAMTRVIDLVPPFVLRDYGQRTY